MVTVDEKQARWLHAEQQVSSQNVEAASLLESLRHPSRTLFSPSDLAKDTGVTVDHAREFLKENKNIIRLALCPDPKWDCMYALRSRSPRPTFREFVSGVRSAVGRDILYQ